MNRPNKELITEWSLNSYADYTNELEKYCDELERKNDYCKDCSHCSLWWKDDYVHKLEKALDKACEKLKQEEASKCFYCDFGHSGADVCDMECWHKSKWKEWLLKDDKD